MSGTSLDNGSRRCSVAEAIPVGNDEGGGAKKADQVTKLVHKYSQTTSIIESYLHKGSHFLVNTVYLENRRTSTSSFSSMVR